MKRSLAWLLALILLLTGCGTQVPAIPNPSAPEGEPVAFADPSLLDPGYTERDLQDTFGDGVKISLADGAISADGPGVEIDGNVVTIAREGTYLLSGTLKGGQIRVILPGDNDKAQLVLDGVDVTCPNGPALYVVQADKVFLTLAPGSENFLTDGAEYRLELNEDEPNAALFSKDDLTINGSGALTVQANYRHGILSKDSLTITGGTIAVDAAEDALRGRDSVAIRDGALTLTAGSDGIQSNNDEDAARGWVAIDGGAIAITAENDGIQAETLLQITGGTLQITTGGGSGTITGEESWQREGMPDMFGGGRGGAPGGGRGGERPNGMMPPDGGTPPEMPGGMTLPDGGTPPEMPDGMTLPDGGTPPEMPDGMTPPDGGTPPERPDGPAERPWATVESTDTPSAKGLKAGTLLRLHGGALTLDCADDALHSDGDVLVSGGVTAIRTGDDGAHANETLSLTGGELTVSVSREGLEGGHVEILGGIMDITARDDGINAAGGSDDEADATFPFGPDRFKADGSSIAISGGSIRVNSGGDGLDSNGDIRISGGSLVVDGPVNNGNGGLDYGSQAVISGGTAIITGSRGMALGFHESSAQFSRLIVFEEPLPEGATLALVDAAGNILLEYTAVKEFSSAVLSAPGMSAETALYVNGALYQQ